MPIKKATFYLIFVNYELQKNSPQNRPVCFYLNDYRDANVHDRADVLEVIFSCHSRESGNLNLTKH